MKTVIGIAGLARTGKDTIGKHLVNRHSFLSLAFARALKEAMQGAFSLNYYEALSDEFKEKPIVDWNNRTPRSLMIEMSDIFKAKFGQDFWIRSLDRRLNHMSHLDNKFVITDVRFENEAQYIRWIGGRIWHVKRDIDRINDHESENGIMVVEGEPLIYNEGSVEELTQKVDKLISNMRVK
jgi:hypothetical protein